MKLETFRYKQTYESYITFSREAKYGILISIRIVYGGLRAYGAQTENTLLLRCYVPQRKNNFIYIYIKLKVCLSVRYRNKTKNI